MKTMNYQRPKVQTLPASRIVELLGPASCGSSRSEKLSIGPSGAGGGGGKKDLGG